MMFFCEKESEHRVTIETGGKIFTAVLYNNETANEFVSRLPLTIEMNELNGNEKYYNFQTSFTTHSKPAGQIRKGEIKIYGDNCLVLFYDSFISEYSYTSLGYINDPSGLADALGTGNVTVKFTIE
ncbi:MAG: hypothetical protein K2K89_01155 [Ruminococcus sp.]|nr:hypothetical protein [Ruminococcus sp.]MDE6424736.1 hypothetical protein [Ruminococcus sp.]